MLRGGLAVDGRQRAKYGDISLNLSVPSTKFSPNGNPVIKACRLLTEAVAFIGIFLLTVLLSPTAPAQTFVQVNAALPTSASQVAAVYTGAQTAGDLNVVIVGWNDTAATVTSLTDTKGNMYALAVGPTLLSGSLSQSIYYAKNITAAAAGANTVTVKFSTVANYPDMRILEYSGVDTNNPLDVATGARPMRMTCWWVRTPCFRAPQPWGPGTRGGSLRARMETWRKMSW